MAPDSELIRPFAAPPAQAVSDAVLARLAQVSSGSLTTQLYRRGFRQPVLTGLRPLQGATVPRFAGRAFTLRMIPAREDVDSYATLGTQPSPANLQWVAVETAEAGDVLVVDSRRDTDAASLGSLLATRLRQRGVRAVVTDGALRDAQEIAAMDWPAWCAGVSATTRLARHHVADLQVPICCAGVAIYPGDVIHGDGDSVSVVPAALAVELALACEAQDGIEAYLRMRLERGEALWGLYPPSAATRAEYERWCQSGCPPLP